MRWHFSISWLQYPCGIMRVVRLSRSTNPGLITFTHFSCVGVLVRMDWKIENISNRMNLTQPHHEVFSTSASKTPCPGPTQPIHIQCLCTRTCRMYHVHGHLDQYLPLHQTDSSLVLELWMWQVRRYCSRRRAFLWSIYFASVPGRRLGCAAWR